MGTRRACVVVVNVYVAICVIMDLFSFEGSATPGAQEGFIPATLAATCKVYRGVCACVFVCVCVCVYERERERERERVCL